MFETRREDQGHTPWEFNAKGRSQYRTNDHLLGDAVGLTYRPQDDSSDFDCICEKDFLEFQQYSDKYPLCWNLSYSFLRHAVLVVKGLATGHAEMHKGILRHNMPKIKIYPMSLHKTRMNFPCSLSSPNKLKRKRC